MQLQLVAPSPFIPQPFERLPELPFIAIFHPPKEPRKTPLPKFDPGGKPPSPFYNLPHQLHLTDSKKISKDFDSTLKNNSFRQETPSSTLLLPWSHHWTIVKGELPKEVRVRMQTYFIQPQISISDSFFLLHILEAIPTEEKCDCHHFLIIKN